jgi:hypothetical protein
MDLEHVRILTTEESGLNMQECVFKIAKCKQSSILTSIQNTYSLTEQRIKS